MSARFESGFPCDFWFRALVGLTTFFETFFDLVLILRVFFLAMVFTIEIDSIRAETTIGDLIVAFPRTRDVLMKHGLRFDVEEAGYLYMTLNVFSAIHGLALTGFLQELDVASKEMPLPPLAAPVRQIASPPTT